MNRKLLSWLAVGSMLLVSACSNDETVGSPADPYVSGEEVTVSFKISPEGKSLATTRAVHYPGENEWAQISDGSKAKQLIYAVYNADYKLLEQYGDNYTDPTKGHYGQVIQEVKDFNDVTISLRLMRNQTYHIVFWAQDKECTAYDTNDLTQVKVDYSNALNNDESRDAFCKTETFTVSSDDQREVILTRPLSQVNVGTAGYDYEAAVKLAYSYDDDEAAGANEPTSAEETTDEEETTDADASKAAKPAFLYSKITLKGVAQYFDVLRNKVLTGEDLTARGITGNATIDAIYNWARIPAYVNYDADKLPANYPLIDTPELSTTPTTVEAWNSYYRLFQEQFLRVKLYSTQLPNNEPYLPYKGEKDASSTLNPTEGKEFSPNTETFKYLSMCYVLVPDYVAEDGQSYKTTLGSVTVWLNHEAKDEGALQLGNSPDYTVPNVPVQRNWRTNIFGKNLLTLDYTPNILVDPIFDGEYNKDSDRPWNKDDNSYGYPDDGDETPNPGEDGNE